MVHPGPVDLGDQAGDAALVTAVPEVVTLGIRPRSASLHRLKPLGAHIRALLMVLVAQAGEALGALDITIVCSNVWPALALPCNPTSHLHPRLLLIKVEAAAMGSPIP